MNEYIIVRVSEFGNRCEVIRRIRNVEEARLHTLELVEGIYSRPREAGVTYRVVRVNKSWA